MGSDTRRKRYFVEAPVQLALIKRVIRYWLLSLFLVGSLTFLGWMFVYPGVGNLLGPDALLSQVTPVFLTCMITSLLVLPIALRDIVCFSNRFVGPLVRIRRSMNELAEGKAVQPIQLRKDDFWHDLARSFNRIAEECQPFASNSTVRKHSISKPKEVFDEDENGILAGSPSVHVMI